MIAHNPYSNCTTARLYYYDFLEEGSRRSIPESTLYHIKECCDCQAEIERLAAMLAHVDENTGSEQHRHDTAIITLLKLHFAFVGDPVTCSIVRPFLASLADPLLRVRIPTPITMHVDRCRACRDDLQTLRDLELTHKQLCRVGRLLADEPDLSSVSCSEARAAIPAVVSAVLRETDAETLKHLCICPRCRKHLYKRREALRVRLLRRGAPADDFSCDAVSPSDIYDYVLPYGIDPADDPYAEFRAPLVSHLSECPDCLAKVQQLHRTISAIAERRDSDVVTYYHLGEAPSDQGRGTRDEGRTTVDFGAALKRRLAALKAKPLLRPGLAAVAALLIGVALLLSPTATAITIDQIYKAVGKVTNVHIATFAADGTKLTHEQWVSRGLNTYLTKTGTLWVLSDVGAGIAKSKDSLTGVIDEKQLAEDEVAGAKNWMSITLALMPFHDIYGIPRDAQWARVLEDTVQSASAGTEVYDLMWTESTSRGIINSKRRFFVDPETKLPHRVEVYQKRSADGEYSLTSVKQVKYMSDAEMEQVIREVSF